VFPNPPPAAEVLCCAHGYAQERKRLIEWRKREKAELAAAKAKAMEKVEEDRRARRIAAGLPPDLTPEELEAKRAKEQAVRHSSRLYTHVSQMGRRLRVDRCLLGPFALVVAHSCFAMQRLSALVSTVGAFGLPGTWR
jgi:hypothetical protein